MALNVMLKVGIIGCGKIATAHVSQIRKFRFAQVIGACSRDSARARQFTERHSVPRFFETLSVMLEDGRPDVVHITTPPDSHFSIARQCLEHGSHVYVEKPFTLDAHECSALIALASVKQLKLTVGHNQQFSHAARRLRSQVLGGYLGGPPVHMESHYGYDLGDQVYARALLHDRNHWVRALPGQLLQNVISHGIARIAEFLQSDEAAVVAIGSVSPYLRARGETELLDELRVVIAEPAGATAYFTFSSQMRPLVHEFRIYGPRNGLLLDQDHDVLLRLRGEKFRSYANTFLPPLMLAAQYSANVAGNTMRFAAGKLHANSGLQYLIGAFYRSIREEAPVPIPYPEIVRSARIMDRIFEQLRRSRSQNVDMNGTHAQR
jgi:predicted dehydrogenase